MSNESDNWMIKASAGSGKTYKLVSRYIELLALHKAPAQIMALTFTRKAAGEFMQKILLRLMDAADNPKEAALANTDCRISEHGLVLEAKDYEALLELFIREIGNVQLGTIDSFFSSLVQVFPFELGLSVPPRLMETHEENRSNELAMKRLFTGNDFQERSELLELYKQATFGVEEKSVYRLFANQISDCQFLYWEDRDTALWGNLEKIFGSPLPWAGAPERADACVERLLSAIERDADLAQHLSTLQPAIDVLQNLEPGETYKGSRVLDQLLEAYPRLAKGRAEIGYRKKTLLLEGEVAEAMTDLLSYFFAKQIHVKAVRTRNLGHLMGVFSRHYDQLIRDTGGLVFADLPRLLVDHMRKEEEQFGSSLLSYRMDMRIDHWLLDEFQDTSRLQWNVLERFISEVLQEAGPERSLFYVGDVKQSIYGWRGGDSRLFDEIKAHYGSGIKTGELECSYRSCQWIIDYVNAIFGNLKSLEKLPTSVYKRWESNWTKHTVEDSLKRQAGFAGLFEVVTDHELEEGCVELLKRLKPLENGLTCAVLVRDNKTVNSLTTALRKAHLRAETEGDFLIAGDNVAGLWLLSTLYEIARPFERMAREISDAIDIVELPEIRLRMMGQVRDALSCDRFARATRIALAALREVLPASLFLDLRMEQLVGAARDYEAGEGKSLEGFIEYLMAAKIRESADRSAIQVMTVHKSKGLDFDVVVTVGLDDQAMVRPDRDSFKAKRNERGRIDWILEFPQQKLAEGLHELREVLEENKDEQTFEALCLLYVAMTRAKRGLYCVYKASSKNCSSTTFIDLFNAGASEAPADGVSDLPSFETLEVRQAVGQFTWIEGMNKKANDVDRSDCVPLLEPLERGSYSVRRPLRRRASPSGVAHGSQRFGEDIPSAQGKAYGSRMHLLLARYEWIDFAGDGANSPAAILEEAPDDLRDRLAEFLKTELARDVFGSAPDEVEVWRERPYALRRDGFVTNGIMDRVLVKRNKNGEAESAMIYDFKTDRLDPNRSAEEQLLEKYHAQLQLYREALSLLEGLELEQIGGRLVPV